MIGESKFYELVDEAQELLARVERMRKLTLQWGLTALEKELALRLEWMTETAVELKNALDVEEEMTRARLEARRR